MNKNKNKPDWSLLTKEEINTLDSRARWNLREKRKRELDKKGTTTKSEPTPTLTKKGKFAKKEKEVVEEEKPVEKKLFKPGPKKVYRKQEYDLIGEVTERQRKNVYRHSSMPGARCERYEDKKEPSGYRWECHPEGCKYGTYYYILRINCNNKPEVKEIYAYDDKIKKYGTEKIWKAIEDKSYIDKRLLFICHFYDLHYKLIDMKELPKK